MIYLHFFLRTLLLHLTMALQWQWYDIPTIVIIWLTSNIQWETNMWPENTKSIEITFLNSLRIYIYITYL